MTFKLLDAGSVQRTITRMRFQDAGVLRTIVRMKVMDTGATLRTVAVFAPTLSLSINPSSTGDSGFDSNILDAAATAIPAGGLGPYTYSWAKISGTTMSLSSTTTATVTFTSPVLTPDVAVSAVYRCTCTDSSGQTATADVTVTFLFYTPPGG